MTHSRDIRAGSDGPTPSEAPGWGGPWPAGWIVAHVPETGSTNDDLLVKVQRGEVGDRHVLATGHQTAGRGRLDRRWDAPPGANLLVSIVVAPPPEPPFLAVQRVAVAALAAVDALAGAARAGLKWPNDLLVDDRKLAGVLAQRSADGAAVVVGLGLNVGWAPPGAASLAADLGLEVHPATVLGAVLVELDRLTDPAEVRRRHRDRLVTLGRRVRVERIGDEVVGTATDLDDDGRLVVDDGAVRHIVDVGDVVHLRPDDT